MGLGAASFLAGCESSECARYQELAPVWQCTDPEVWGTSTACPTDDELAARPGGFETLAECVEFLESQCDPGLEVGCSCLTDDSCRCDVPLGELRTACGPAER